MAFLLLLLMLPACAAVPEDMSGKMFIFPEETDTIHVELIPSVTSFSALTVCLRSITDLTRAHTLFSLSTSTYDDAFLIYKSSASERMSVNVKSTAINFEGQDYRINQWVSICATWDSASDLVQLWLDGKPSVRKYVGVVPTTLFKSASAATISGPIIILGQDQDNHGGGFDSIESFVGMISDVHMWDRVLSACEIQNFPNHRNFVPGNVLNWRALDFVETGNVVKEDIDQGCHPTSPPGRQKNAN